jgi:N-acetylneuraminic acid mutarotase/cell division protein FtsB
MRTQFTSHKLLDLPALSRLPLFFALLLMLACGTLQIGIEPEATPANRGPVATVAVLATKNARLATQVAVQAADNARLSTEVAASAAENARLSTQAAASAAEDARLATQVAVQAADSARLSTQVVALAAENARLGTQVAESVTAIEPQAAPTAVPPTPVRAGQGRWTPARSLTLPRGRHTATLLPDGRVLLVGGYTQHDVDTTSVDIYDPATDTYEPTGSLNAARHDQTATLLPDGRVLVIAGYNLGWLSSAEIWDPATGQWSPTQPLFAHGVTHTATVLKDGRVLVVAGSKQSGSSGPDDRVEIFNPLTNVWQKAALHQYTEGCHTATLLADGRVLIAGGGTDPALYDPAGDTWQPAGRLAVERCYPRAVLLHDGRVLLIGGVMRSQWPTPIDSVEVYDPTSNSWGQAAPLAQARYDQTTTLLPDGRVLVVGGARLWDTNWNDPGAILSSVEIYDPVGDTWSPLPPLRHARVDHTATLLPDGRIFVTGGSPARDTYFDSAEILELGSR